MVEEQHLYRAYGLNIRSDFPLTELTRGEGTEQLYIKRGFVSLPQMSQTAIARQGIPASFGGMDRAAYLHWQGVASFLAQEGHTLIVQP